MMKKPFKNLFIRRIKPQMIFIFLEQYLCLGLLLLGVNNLTWAAKPNCAEERMAVTQALATHLPADPQILKNSLELRREGDVMCQKGQAESGRAKLNSATKVLNPESIDSDLPNQKGNSHE